MRAFFPFHYFINPSFLPSMHNSFELLSFLLSFHSYNHSFFDPVIIVHSFNAHTLSSIHEKPLRRHDLPFNHQFIIIIIFIMIIFIIVIFSALLLHSLIQTFMNPFIPFIRFIYCAHSFLHIKTFCPLFHSFQSAFTHIDSSCCSTHPEVWKVLSTCVYFVPWCSAFIPWLVLFTWLDAQHLFLWLVCYLLGSAFLLGSCAIYLAWCSAFPLARTLFSCDEISMLFLFCTICTTV